ncbi:hypothetical protein RFF05_04290 [Bengtsoniella intestinalis]|uniref:hypothetical protein n=1 Tax=Bengtsoniella intestinalis TaxID=3073143 RepID=UPI00391F3826
MNKRNLLPLLTLVTAMALVGCGRDNNTQDHQTMEPDTTTDNANPFPSGEILGDDTVTDYGIDSPMNQTYDQHEDEHLEFGIPFDEMLENAYIHDTDGNLNDGENAKHDDFLHYETDK